MFASAKKYLLIAAGMICVGLGVAGIFLPLLPTTPFLLLAATCFFSSSKRLYDWLLGNRVFGNYIKYYRLFHAIPLRAKLLTLIFLWTVIGYSAVFVASALWLRLLLLSIALGVSTHILRFRTLTSKIIAEEGKSGDELSNNQE